MGKKLKRKPNYYWKSWKNLTEELSHIINQLGHFPSPTEIKALGRGDLEHGMYRFHGGRVNIARRLGYELPKNKPHLFPKLNPSNELAYILGVLKGDGYIFPSNPWTIVLSQINKEFGDSFADALRKINLNPRIDLIKESEKKDTYRTTAFSKAFCNWYRFLELKQIENMLTSSKEFIRAFLRGFFESEGCNYIREDGKGWVIYFSNTNKELLLMVQRLLKILGFDFYIKAQKDRPDVIRGKTIQRHKIRYRLLSLKKRQNYKFIEEIKPCIKNWRVEKEKIPTKDRKPDGYWKDWEHVEAELNELIHKLGHFPSCRELKRLRRNDLVDAIRDRHGGFLKIREKLGHPLNCKPAGYWNNIENLRKELKLIIAKLGHFPTQEELKEKGRHDLKNATYRYGGLIKLRKEMGFLLQRKPSGYWKSWNNLLKELIPTIKSLGYFPTQEELRQLKKSGLIQGMRYHGGLDTVKRKIEKSMYQS